MAPPIGDKRFFLPNMERMYPLSYLQYMSVHRTMEWDLSWFFSGMSLGKLGAKDGYTVGHGNDVFGLFPGLVDLSIRKEKLHSLPPPSSISS